jgi:hypothetical protein
VGTLDYRLMDEGCHQAVLNQVGVFLGSLHPKYRRQIDGSDSKSDTNLTLTRAPLHPAQGNDYHNQKQDDGEQKPQQITGAQRSDQGLGGSQGGVDGNQDNKGPEPRDVAPVQR